MLCCERRRRMSKWFLAFSIFDRVSIMPGTVWSPNFQCSQLLGVLFGFASIRSSVDVGNGVRHLIVLAMCEYKKDGQIVGSIYKGALAFEKTMRTELVNSGAKLKIVTQPALQDTEKLLG